MAGVSRLGDTSDHGGYIASATGNLVVNGIRCAVSGDMHVCPIHGHGTTPITASSNFKTAGKSVVRVGDVAGCGAVIVTGSSNMNVNI